MTPLHRTFAALAALSLLSTAAAAQDTAEAGAARYLETVRGQTPLLIAFLREMPKGGDLHSHLSGAVYAESFLRWAGEDGACVNRTQLRIVPAPCAPAGDSLVSATRLATDGTLYGRMIDVMSMRNWHPARLNGHDQFFGTFGRLESTDRRTGDMLAEVQERAAAGGVSYLELMFTPDRSAARAVGDRVGWRDAEATHAALLSGGIGEVVQGARLRIDSVEARRDTVLQCGTPAARPGCGVVVRYLYQVARANAPERVYAQLLAGFLMAQRDPRVVGVNMVQPEDAPLAMRDYSLHMRMVAYLRGRHAPVRASLHAGELAAGLVPPEGLRFHIREAVQVAGAARIGHGVDVMHEDGAHELLRAMAERRVLVEIALTSNDVILGVSGNDHPLRTYLAAGVPVALATDDEGVARSEMTMEYLRAVQDQGLDYPTLKGMARNSLEHAFEPGSSLWQDTRSWRMVSQCEQGWEARSCVAYLRDNARARLQANLERSFAAFEAKYQRAPHQE